MGDLEMDTAALPAVLGVLDAAGDELGRAWGAGQAEIAGHEGGIGAGPLGVAFGGVYRPEADTARAAAGRVPPDMTNTAATGQDCVADYVAGEARATSGFRVFDDTYATGI